MALTQEALDDLVRRGAARGVDPAPGLAIVEQHLRTRVAADLPFAQEASQYLIAAGGKRFRPMLVLLAGMLGGREPTDDDLISGGVIVELVHLSSLYHDDVIDAAETRRGLPAAQLKWSNTVAILTGDFLLARASELSAALGVEVTRLMARTIAELAQGQVREVQGSQSAAGHGAPRVVPDRAHYLAVIDGKTASLIAASARLGGMLSGLPSPTIEALAEYGRHLGMAFQLSDDVLDIAGEATESGKVPGTDLREGVRTLPVLYALAQDGPDSELASALEAAVGATDDEPVRRALTLLREHPALRDAREEAHVAARRAVAALAPINRTPDTGVLLDGLAEFASYAVTRVT